MYYFFSSSPSTSSITLHPEDHLAIAKCDGLFVRSLVVRRFARSEKLNTSRVYSSHKIFESQEYPFTTKRCEGIFECLHIDRDEVVRVPFPPRKASSRIVRVSAVQVELFHLKPMAANLIVLSFLSCASTYCISAEFFRVVLRFRVRNYNLSLDISSRFTERLGSFPAHFLMRSVFSYQIRTRVIKISLEVNSTITGTLHRSDLDHLNSLEFQVQ